MKLKYETVVILVNYNGFEDTQACLESIGKVKGDLPFVVVVDNASSENENIEELSAIYSRLRIIRNFSNLGFGRANNIGINWAKENLNFDYLLLLNNDTIIEPASLLELKKAFSHDPKIGITTSKIMYEGNKNIVWYGGGDINRLKGWPKIYDYNKEPSYRDGSNRSRYVTFASGCVMMFTRKSILDLVGFDDKIFMYCEDLELSMRAEKMDYKIYYEPKSIIYHKVQGSSKKAEDNSTDGHPKNSNSLFLFYHMRSNQYYTMKKHLSHREFVVFNFHFWSSFIYKNFRMIRYKKFGVFRVSRKIIKNILKNETGKQFSLN